MALLFVLVAVAAPSPVPAKLARVAEKMRQIQSLQVDLEQEKELGAFGDVMRSKGRLSFARPRKLMMDLTGAGGSILILDGDRLTMHYKALGKTEVTELSKDPRARAVAEHLFLLLKADPEPLSEVYTITLSGDAPLQVRLKPKAQALARIIGHVDAQFDARGFVAAMTIHESGGDQTRWTFKNPIINGTLPADHFKLPPSAP